MVAGSATSAVCWAALPLPPLPPLPPLRAVRSAPASPLRTRWWRKQPRSVQPWSVSLRSRQTTRYMAQPPLATSLAADTARRIDFRAPGAHARASAPLAAAETERALLTLEEEWQVRLEAPITQLAQFEQALNRAIDRVHASLPLS